MKPRKLRTRVPISFFVIILTFALSIAVAAHRVIKNNIIEQAQMKVKNDLNSASDKGTLTEELDKVRNAESLNVLSLTYASGEVFVRCRNPSVGNDSHAEDSTSVSKG
jgi:hypothetical protein